MTDLVTLVLQARRELALVHRVQVRVQQADRDRFGLGADLGHPGRQCHQDLAARSDPLAHLVAMCSTHQRVRAISGRVVQRRPVLAGDLEHVGEPLGRDQGDDRAAAFEQGVGRDRGPVGEHRRMHHIEPGESGADRAARIVAGRQDLRDATVGRDQVGERAPGVAANAHRRSVPKWATRPMTSAGPGGTNGAMASTGTRRRRKLIGRRPVVELIDDETTVDLRDGAHAWWAERDADDMYVPPPRGIQVDPDAGARRSGSFTDYFTNESLFASPEDFDDRAPAQPTTRLGQARATLGVSASATWDDIVAAHRRLAKIFHPDVVGVADDGTTMREINAAYAELRAAHAR